MSYDFHIVRAAEKPITNEEWNALVESEPGEWRIEKELPCFESSAQIENSIAPPRKVLLVLLPEFASLGVFRKNATCFPRSYFAKVF